MFLEDGPNPNDLHELARLVEELQKAQLELAKAEAEVARCQTVVRYLAEDRIPTLMTEVNVEKFTTGDGRTISVSPIYTASIPAELREEAYRWLEENGHGGMIKHSVVVQFPRDKKDQAAYLAESLGSEYANVKTEGKVEPSTLRAWVRARMENSEPFPKALFGAGQIRRAKINE